MVTMWPSLQAHRQGGTLVESTRLRVRLLTPLYGTTGNTIRCNSGRAREEENRLRYRGLQARAVLCNVLFITRNELNSQGVQKVQNLSS